MRLKEIKFIEGDILLKTGLHIGAGSDEIHIGGIDTPVVKDPLTNWPYIPGSSLKGKIRTLLEWATNKVRIDDGKPWIAKNGNGLDPIARIFGNGGNDNNYNGGPTRVSFSDCFMFEEKAKEMIERGVLTEEKIEVSIDRSKGAAKKGGLRKIERVPAGATFKFEISYKVYDMEDDGNEDEENFNLLLMGMKLLEYDALGGSGSRGYGRIKFENVEINGKGVDFDGIDISQKAFDKFVKKG
jgi:CRISPR-associated protein Csm3